MHKPLPLLLIFSWGYLSHAQKIDTLILHYKPNQYNITKADRQKLDSFIIQGWDRISINGYTDETDEEDYNLALSEKRSGEVYDYLIAKKLMSSAVSSHYFGESMPIAENSSEERKALNRRTEIIGFRFARIAPLTVKQTVDPMQQVTKTLDNGFIITYRPGTMPDYMAANFEAGSAMNFQLINNTSEMRQYNMYNNTTNGEILSSVLIVCGNQFNPCKLDSPVLLRIPIPAVTNCPIEKVKFFNTVAENGKRIWQEQSKLLYPEVINGKQYIRLWIDNFCECINFDFKIDPDCYDTDSIQVQYVNSGVKRLSAELKGLNSVYVPRNVNDSTFCLLYLKDKLNEAAISFSLYDGKRRVRSFRNQPLSAFPYDQTNKRYVLSKETVRLYFRRLRVADVMLKVNGDKYRVVPDNRKYEFVYLNRKTETILVDFSIIGPGGHIIQFKNQPLNSLPYDEDNNQRVVNKKFLKELKQAESITAL